MENINNEIEHVKITGVHLILHQESSIWEVRIFEKEFSYQIGQYDNFDFAYEMAKIIEHRCPQDISIFIIAGDETQIQITKEKLTDEAAFLLFLKSIHTLYIYFDHKAGTWDVYTINRHSAPSVTKSQSKEEAIAAAEQMKEANPDIQIVMLDEIDIPFTLDNTCRVRKCKWNAHDTCILKPRGTNLPLPHIDHTHREWTEFNSIVPGMCKTYERVCHE